MKTKRLRSFALLAVVALLSACGTTAPTNFYTLSAETAEQAPPGEQKRVLVGIGPVEVAAYLERSQIVTRPGPTRLSLTELNHWAEPVESNVAGVLATNLSRLLPSVHPIARPWTDAEAEYHVLVKILRFDSDSAGNVQLIANWGIQVHATRSMPLIRDAAIRQASIGEDYEAITKNMSLALAKLSEEIALELGKLTGSAR